MVLFHLFFLLHKTFRPKYMILIDLFLLFAHDHSTKIYGPLSFILSFAIDRVRPKDMVFFHLFFLLCTTIRPKIMVLIDLFLLFAHDHSTKIYGPLSFILSFAIERVRPKDMVLFHLFFLLCTTIRPKIMVLIDLFLLSAHDHSTKSRGHSYTLIFYFFNWANISYAIFMAVPLL